MGNAQFNLGRLQEATDAWTTCTVKSALFPYAYDNLAVAWWKLGDFTEAIAVLEHARSLGVEINASLLSALRAAAGDSPAKTHP